MDFQTALNALETIIRNLEKGDAQLENAITLYERGELLKEHCENILKNAEEKINKIVLAKKDKALKTEPFKETPENTNE